MHRGHAWVGERAGHYRQAVALAGGHCLPGRHQAAAVSSSVISVRRAIATPACRRLRTAW